jgi:hypothetical protein
MSHSPPTDAELRDAAQRVVEGEGYKVTRKSDSRWILERRDGAVSGKWETGVRAVKNQPSVPAAKSNFYITPFRASGAPIPRAPDELWLVAWYRVNPTKGTPEILVTLGERRKLDGEKKYAVVVNGRPLATMQSADCMVRKSLPL